ncbi:MULTISPECIES: serine/threonine protein kinase [Streptosporangium]|uniref:non-specific serine/threonine protein kinase n=1 Tax=Streptosporangium brasiliense TaxID=47480 RepID=A0ABT9RJF7_9ACTN|nr:serine/threonine-protein kinase [Streptosporangium brasiliense]MDP9868430.1 serine/threonine protein kinase [Streptosporangium brasiliense]
MPEWMALLPSDLEAVGPYRLEGRLGTGGQGTVYVGSAVPGQRVAIKLLHPHLVVDKSARARFLSEVEIAKRVALFCTAKVLDSGSVNGQPYIVSEFVEGPSLQESVRSTGPRSGAALERLALNTATALAAIHQADVVHRDFKPGNVLLGLDGPVVIDFGIARALDLSRSIITSQVVGSPGYMAPEQIADGEVGPAADLFAWGATMVFAATGERAFKGESIPAVMRSILYDEPDLTWLDGRLCAIVRACLAKDPARRPTAAEVVDGLRGLPGPAWLTGNPPAGQAAGARQGDGQDRTPAGSVKRRRSVLAGATVLALFAALGIAYSLIPSDPGGENSDASRAPRSSPPSGATTVSPSPADTVAGRTGSPSPRPRTVPTAGTRNPRRPDGTRSPASEKPPSQSDGKDKSPSRSDVSEKPRSDPEEKPSRPAVEEKSSPRPGVSEKPSSDAGEQPTAGPKVLGTVSGSDMNGYCQDQGYAAAGGGPGYYWCYGPGGKQVDMTAVCRWAYPGYPDARADGTTCKSS